MPSTVQQVFKQNLGSFFDSAGAIESNKVNPKLPIVTSIPLTAPPALTGNTANINSFVVDPTGTTWFIDYGGNAIKLTSPPMDVVGTFAAPAPTGTLALNATTIAAPGSAQTLPTAIGNKGKMVVVKKTATGTVTITTTAGQTVDGAPSVSMRNQSQSLSYVSDGANWILVEGFNENAIYSVRNCPVNTGGAYTLTAADIAGFDVFRLQNGSHATPITLPPAGSGQVDGQSLTIESAATNPVRVAIANSTLGFPIDLTANSPALEFVWDQTALKWRQVGSNAVTTVLPAAGSYLSAIVNQGIPVVFDNLQIRVSPSGARGLQFATVAGTMTVNGSDNASASGALSGVFTNKVINGTFAQLWPYNFSIAGHVEHVYLIEISTSRAYKVECIFGPTFNSNLITVTRLN